MRGDKEDDPDIFIDNMMSIVENRGNTAIHSKYCEEEKHIYDSWQRAAPKNTSENVNITRTEKETRQHR